MTLHLCFEWKHPQPFCIPLFICLLVLSLQILTKVQAQSPCPKVFMLLHLPTVETRGQVVTSKNYACHRKVCQIFMGIFMHQRVNKPTTVLNAPYQESKKDSFEHLNQHHNSKCSRHGMALCSMMTIFCKALPWHPQLYLFCTVHTVAKFG